jgi:nucleotide-binding universal stress UspA family protein
MIELVGVPVDGSPFGELALPFALGLTHRLGCKLLLIYTPDFWIESSDRPALPREDNKKVKKYLGQVRQALTDPATPDFLSPDRIMTQELELSPEGAMPTLTPNLGANIIVMPTTSRYDLFHLLQFHLLQVNQVQKALGHSLIPLILLKPGEGELEAVEKLTLQERLQLAATSPVSPPESFNLLVALDGTAQAESILYPAAALVTQAGGTLYLLRVYFKLWDSEYDGLELSEDAFYGSEIWKENATRQYIAYHYLEQIKARLVRSGCEVVIAIRGGETSEEILKYSQEIGASMLAITGHSRNKRGHLVMGSVADRVLNYCQKPALLVNSTSITKEILAVEFNQNSPPNTQAYSPGPLQKSLIKA